MLSLHETGRVVDTDYQTSSHFRIEGATVTGLVNLQDALNPSHDFVGGGIGWFVEINDSISLEFLKSSLGRGTSAG